VNPPDASGILRGGIYRIRLDPTVGREIQKTRPCVVVQRDSANATSPLVIVCPLTDANGRSGNLLNVFVPAGMGGTDKDSLVLCNSVRSVDKARIVSYEGALAPLVMTEVNKGLRAILDL
jgi:mRNA interferase MazF